MYSNYFKIALRGFTKHKLTFFINLFGLSLGLWATISIGLWVKSELQMNQSFAEMDQVYRIMEHQRYGSDIFTTTSTPGILAAALKEEYPEVERSACYSWNESALLVAGENRISMDGFYADPDFLHILQYEFLNGDRDQALTEISHIVLSKEGAIKLFGKTDVVGETVVLKETDGEASFQVMGVVDVDPELSSNRFEYILPFKFMFDKPYNGWLQRWGNNGPSTIVKLHKNANGQEFSDKIEDFIAQRNEGSNVKLFAFPEKDLYLHGKFKDGLQQGGRIEFVRLFAVIGIFILLIACINFMNLSTAKSQKRSKEVGVRKVAGAEKKELVFQFLTESLVISLVAGISALVMVELTLPIFNRLADKSMSVPYENLAFWSQWLAVVVITGIVAGSYPAFYLSATKVVSVFKNLTKSGRGIVMARKGLVVFQFVLATMLILATIVVYKQINYALNKDLGYNKDQLLIVQLEGKLFENFDVYRAELEQFPEILGVTRSTHSMLGRSSNTGDVTWEGKDPDFTALFEIMRVDHGFIETLGLNLIKGEDFSRERISDSTGKAILNRRAYDLITKDNPTVNSFNWNEETQILGVVEDFHFQSFHQGIEPVIITLDPTFASLAFIKVSPENISQTLQEVKKVTEAFEPFFPFKYSFMDENYATLYKDDVRTRELAKYFSILTILISCLGLFGLSAHIAEQKTKEIGIRKVLGASTISILHVINKEFIAIVSVSIILGSGISYYLIQDWLQGYAYRIDFEWWFILLAAFGILSIAYLTVSLQALKAAHINPANTLKSE
ncbi:ABC transporter permease [Fontibacter flavus]|uniref:ABC transporter permease n=1 Tax=Fontibacter flavus TaxID=654838 RepID=A0ABV6FX75_9BACT